MNLKMQEIKAFVPAKDFDLSKKFYQAIGFTLTSDFGDIAYFHFEDCSFLLQSFYVPEHANNFMMHVLVEDIQAWNTKIVSSGVADEYGTRISDVTEQPWKMLDFVVYDPSGVLWRFGQNIT